MYRKIAYQLGFSISINPDFQETEELLNKCNNQLSSIIRKADERF